MNELYRTNIVYFYIISCWKQVLFSCYLRFGLTVVVNFNNARARHMWQLCIPTRESSSCFVLLLLHLWASCSFATPLPRYSCEWSFLWVGRWDPLYKWWLALNNRPWASEGSFQGRDTSGFNTNFSRWGVKVVKLVFYHSKLRKQPFFAKIIKIQGSNPHPLPRSSDAHANVAKQCSSSGWTLTSLDCLLSNELFCFLFVLLQNSQPLRTWIHLQYTNRNASCMLG